MTKRTLDLFNHCHALNVVLCNLLFITILLMNQDTSLIVIKSSQVIIKDWEEEQKFYHVNQTELQIIFFCLMSTSSK